MTEMPEALSSAPGATGTVSRWAPTTTCGSFASKPAGSAMMFCDVPRSNASSRRTSSPTRPGSTRGNRTWSSARIWTPCRSPRGRGQRLRRRCAAGARPAGCRRAAGLPVQFIAFGAEEPRGTGDDAAPLRLAAARRRSVPCRAAGGPRHGGPGPRGRAGDYVPVCRAGPRGPTCGPICGPPAAGSRCHPRVRQPASDHWSYEKAGMPAARLGSIPYAGYHSRRDMVCRRGPRQLNRVGTLMWTWLKQPG